MAIIGQNVQAGLGRIDYTPYLQGASMGAQGIAQGISSLGKSASTGIDKFLKNKEEDKAALATIKVSEPLIRGLKSLADQQDANGNPIISPEIKASIDQFSANISDPSISNKDRARIATQGIQQFSGLINAGVSSAQTKAQLAQTLAQTKVYENNAVMLANQLNVEKTDNAALSSALKSLVESEGKVSNSNLIKEYISNGGSINGLKTLKSILPEPKGAGKIDTFETVDANGNPIKRTIETFPDGTRQVLADAPILEKGTRLNAQGVVEPIPGGALSEKQKQQQDALKLAAEDARRSAESTIRAISDAKVLINKPLAQGFGSSVSGFFGGTSGNDLEATYDIIRSNQALGQIIALKKASPTGTTGFGALNLKELETMQDRNAKLNRSMSDEAALNSLNELQRIIAQAFPGIVDQVEAEKQAEKQRSMPTGSPYAAPVSAGSRFEIIKVNP